MFLFDSVIIGTKIQMCWSPVIDVFVIQPDLFRNLKDVCYLRTWAPEACN